MEQLFQRGELFFGNTIILPKNLIRSLLRLLFGLKRQYRKYNSVQVEQKSNRAEYQGIYAGRGVEYKEVKNNTDQNQRNEHKGAKRNQRNEANALFHIGIALFIEYGKCRLLRTHTHGCQAGLVADKASESYFFEIVAIAVAEQQGARAFYFDLFKTGADITKNRLIKSNIPNSKIVKKVVGLAKSGTPVIKFKGGSGKVVFITAGVHGNELSSQVAAMRMIKYLASHPINGTVYIMPFMHPKATAKNVRDYSVKLNSHADVKGTVSYKTVKLIVKFKASAYGDFHCTRPGGKPGKNIAMGTYKPTGESAKLAEYISTKSHVAKLIYDLAGAEYPGALEDVVSLKGIPAVTCEVVTPHGTIAAGSVEISLSMMKSL